MCPWSPSCMHDLQIENTSCNTSHRGPHYCNSICGCDKLKQARHKLMSAIRTEVHVPQLPPQYGSFVCSLSPSSAHDLQIETQIMQHIMQHIKPWTTLQGNNLQEPGAASAMQITGAAVKRTCVVPEPQLLKAPPVQTSSSCHGTPSKSGPHRSL